LSTQNNQDQTPSRFKLWLLPLPVLILISLYWFFIAPGTNSKLIRYDESSKQIEIPEWQESLKSSQSPEISELNYSRPSPDTPWVALIIDDFGPALKRSLVRGFLELPFDITLAVLPGNDRTEKVGRTAALNGKEIFIHLPMESIDSVFMNERDMIYTGMNSEAIARIIDRAVKELPDAVGVNNHMGSRATADSGLMTLFAHELKRQNLMFVDSWTVPYTFGLKVMKTAGVPALGRDIFLDFYEGTDRISEQLKKTISIARRRGWAIGIGHVKRETLNVLKKELSYWEDNRIKFVFVSDLIEVVVNNKVEENVLSTESFSNQKRKFDNE